jgi:DNA-binding HxlR family transcriptional regulator
MALNVPELDKKCEVIFSAMLLADKEMRFNELYRFITKTFNEDMSRPSLLDHLRHLEEKQLVKRNPIGTQNVTYSLIVENIYNIKEAYKESFYYIKHNTEDKKRFNSLSVYEQTNQVYMCATLKNMVILRKKIENMHNDRKTFVNNLETLLWEKFYFYNYERYLYDLCDKDKQYSLDVIKELDRIIKVIEKGCFEEIDPEAKHID